MDGNASTTANDNRSHQELVRTLIDNRSLDPPQFWILIAIYSVVIFAGTVENLFIVTVVIRKPYMRTARNMFILNLAISDLLLCLITAPLTIVEVVCIHWPLVKWQFLCKMIGILQGTSIFVSTLTIIAIALDRYQVIVCPTNHSLQLRGSMLVLGVIWILAIILVSPVYIFKRLYTYPTGIPEMKTVSYCMEKWPITNGRAYYSVFCLIVQYIIPIAIVSIAYRKIYAKLKNRFTATTLTIEIKKEKERGRKIRKTNALLIAIAVVYGVSWLPLNMLNLITDIDSKMMDQKRFLVVFSVCHLMGMSSACSNPLLYGWLNDNFRKEFIEMLNFGGGGIGGGGGGAGKRSSFTSGGVHRRSPSANSHRVVFESGKRRYDPEEDHDQEATETCVRFADAVTDATSLAR